jgi:hypothetical protein
MTFDAVVITVVYVAEVTFPKAGENPSDIWTASFPDLDSAKRAPLPPGARSATIDVEGGHLVRTLDEAWDFVARAGGDGMDAARE